MLKRGLKLNFRPLFVVLMMVIVADIADKIIKQCYRDKNGAEVEALLRFSFMRLLQSFLDLADHISACFRRQLILNRGINIHAFK